MALHVIKVYRRSTITLHPTRVGSDEVSSDNAERASPSEDRPTRLRKPRVGVGRHGRW